MKVRCSGELALIDWMRKHCVCSSAVKTGIGDDTAVLPLNTREDLLLTTDLLVEGTHFTKSTLPHLVGRKALARNLSDIAAMGGTPTCAVVSLGLPTNTPTTYVRKVYQGLNRLAKAFSVSIVGGDTVKSRTFVINIALLGRVAKGRAILRSGARVGDHIFVSGCLGGSLKSDRHLTFTPRIAHAQYLLKNFCPTAMIDISDGLAGDLGHLLEESRVGAVIDEEKIPLHRGASLKAGLYDGEDFELLFTVRPNQADKLLKQNNKSFFRIGAIIKDQNKLYVRQKNDDIRLIPAQGFTHF
ncbi:MAG: thiamine-phosphate kinase [Candidatus Omnitrophica bacterium]|nr:thiamine-phosphate kinase [Candidatus Omnitrophota bacterium]